MKIKPGNHIFIQRYNPIKYTHHGIVITNNTVAHPVMRNGTTQFIITDISGFIGNPANCIDCDIFDKQYPTILNKLKIKLAKNPLCLIKVKSYEKTITANQVISNALNFIQNKPKYCVFSQNCEMFAEYCSTGQMPVVCDQVIDNLIDLVGGKLEIKNVATTVLDLFDQF